MEERGAAPFFAATSGVGEGPFTVTLGVILGGGVIEEVLFFARIKGGATRANTVSGGRIGECECF